MLNFVRYVLSVNSFQFRINFNSFFFLYLSFLFHCSFLVFMSIISAKVWWHGVVVELKFFRSELLKTKAVNSIIKMRHRSVVKFNIGFIVRPSDATKPWLLGNFLRHPDIFRISVSMGPFLNLIVHSLLNKQLSTK
jgi:hypothetical protein